MVACLHRDNYDTAGRGAYDYLRHLKLIALRAGDPPGSWREQADSRDSDDKTGPVWSITKTDAAGLSVIWSDKGKSLPIRLARDALQDPDGWRLR